MNTVWTPQLEDDLQKYFAQGNTCCTYFANRNGIDYKTVGRKARKLGLITSVRKISARKIRPSLLPILSDVEITRQEAGKLIQDCYLAWENCDDVDPLHVINYPASCVIRHAMK